jgi:hypothetical protein
MRSFVPAGRGAATAVVAKTAIKTADKITDSSLGLFMTNLLFYIIPYCQESTASAQGRSS